MFQLIKNENMDDLITHNIRVSELKTSPENMSQPPTRKIIHLPKIRMLGRPGRPQGSGIRITNIQSIKPPDPELVKKAEEGKLRAQVHKEIELRSRTCANKSYQCLLPVLTSREYCAEHILQDPTAPYKQCAYTFNNGERCPEAAPANQNTDRKDYGLCFEHARAALLSRQRTSAPPPPVTTTETILNQLQHYVSSRRRRTSSCASSVSVVSDGDDIPNGPPPDPFKDIDVNQVSSTLRASRVDCGSPVDSDAESVTLGRDGDCRGGPDEDLSGEEEPSYDLAPLRHAGIFTAEEAVLEALTALKMLHSAYGKQMTRLKTLLRSARHTYVKNIKSERELYCSINSQARTGPLTVKERRQLRKLKAYASYHKTHGIDAVLARKLQRKRARAHDVAHRGLPSAAKCVYSDEGVKCGQPVLPASRHCLKHCIHDRNQVLFVECGADTGLCECREPVWRGDGAHCVYHSTPPPHTVFNIRKEDTDSDDSEATNTAMSDCSQTDTEFPTTSDDRHDTPHDRHDTSRDRHDTSHDHHTGNHVDVRLPCRVENVEYGGNVL